MQQALSALLVELSTFVRRYPRQLMALVSVLALSTGGAALAVATFVPDPADLPVRAVLETVQPLALEPQHEQLANSAQLLYRFDTTRAADTAESLLSRLDVDDPEAAEFLRRDSLARSLLLGRAGRAVSAQVTDDNHLLALQARWNGGEGRQFRRLTVRRQDGHWTSHQDQGELQPNTRLASGVIHSSLFAATDEARIPDAIATQIAEVFAGDIDFHRALRKGDRFSVVYETLEADGEPLRYGRVLSAEFVNAGKTYQAMWFQEPGQNGGYYTLDGQSLRRAYLTSPMAFSRVTSGFKMRFHPILQKWRAHNGVDYAAPTGTPVRTVGDGTVEFAGVQNGFGNVVIVQHRNQHSTVYAHLSRIFVRRGQPVAQGQDIGAVGATGWATGPHLHFEFRVNGQFRDPLTIARQSEAIPVSAAARPQFAQLAAQMRPALAAARSVQLASAQ